MAEDSSRPIVSVFLERLERLASIFHDCASTLKRWSLMEELINKFSFVYTAVESSRVRLVTPMENLPCSIQSRSCGGIVIAIRCFGPTLTGFRKPLVQTAVVFFALRVCQLGITS